eukprot:gnl/MRDRNA2_/MRDRNA2_80802_c0_seq1.p1 gnl/MRDRNA2_/MRDRNA2_80802_c0~~gnl/MRDRNA2_/MRDRNA2_80802_c0_seq1.p1  ORF type:complete len:146 (-),score=16.87 gnl/MRDRNA2_/MRDRNA2_80802_c0_seq1:109-546(-)
MVLSASYEATLWVGLLTALRHGGDDPRLRLPGPRRVYLTCLGGGVFGNPMSWITTAMKEALSKFENVDLEVCIVTYYDDIDKGLLELERRFRGVPAGKGGVNVPSENSSLEQHGNCNNYFIPYVIGLASFTFVLTVLQKWRRRVS